jgi:hypothetical protein
MSEKKRERERERARMNERESKRKEEMTHQALSHLYVSAGSCRCMNPSYSVVCG